MSTYRRDLEVRDKPTASEPPGFSGSVFIKPTTSIEITTLEYGANLQPLLSFDGRGHGRFTLHFEGGPRAVARLRDRLTEYLLLVDTGSAEKAVITESGRREADASEEGGA